jgi:hypothetical protein
MVIVGINFTKINVEKKSLIAGKVNINNNISIKDVEEKDLALGKSKQKGLRFLFEFTSKYEPDIGHIFLNGDVIYLGEEKQIKDLATGWKKNKRLPKEIMTHILNNVLTKCNIEALILSGVINLPPPIPLPKVQETKEKQS